MVFLGNIGEGSLRPLQFLQDIIYGRNRNLRITTDEGIVLIKGLAAEGAGITPSPVIDDTGNRVENRMIDLSELVTFDFGGWRMT